MHIVLKVFTISQLRLFEYFIFTLEEEIINQWIALGNIKASPDHLLLESSSKFDEYIDNKISNT